MKSATVLVLGLLLCATSAWSADRKFISVGNSFAALSKILDEHSQVPGVNEKSRKVTPDAERVAKDMAADLETCITTELSKPEVVTLDSNGMNMTFKNFHIRMDGPNCPVEMETIVDSKKLNDEEMVGDFSSNVILKNSDFINKYNLKQVQIKGHMLARSKQVGDKVVMFTEIGMNGSGDSTVIGKFEQDMKFSFSFEMNPMTFDISMMTENSGAIKYNGVDNKIYGMTRMSGFSDFEKKYTYNGQDISETDFQMYSQGFVLPGMVEEEDPTAPDAKVPSECEYVVYEKSKLTADALRPLMTQGAAPKAGVIASGKTCGKDIQQNFSYNGQSYTNEIKFDKEWINYSGSFLTDKEPTSLFLIYQDDVPQTIESNEFTIGLQCKPVQFCN